MRCSDIGAPDAKIVLVGEAPGEEEERTGIPFCGSSGRILKSMLAHSGINFSECYVTNVMDIRPPGNDFKYFYNSGVPTQQLVEAQQKLRNKIEAIRPNVVITLGAEPLKALCGKSSISAYRGTWLSFRGINVMPTYHPAYVMRQYKEHAVVELDFVKAVTQQPAKFRRTIIASSVAEIANWIETEAKGRVAFDIETLGKRVRCIGFASDKSAICIPLIRTAHSSMLEPTVGSTIVRIGNKGTGSASSYWSVSDEILVIDLVDKLLRNNDVQKVGHNSISFDATVLYDEYGLVVNNHYLDTMHAWHHLYTEFPQGLDFVMSVLTNYPNYWSDLDTSNDAAVFEYNCRDCIVTYDISFSIEKELYVETMQPYA